MGTNIICNLAIVAIGVYVDSLRALRSHFSTLGAAHSESYTRIVLIAKFRALDLHIVSLQMHFWLQKLPCANYVTFRKANLVVPRRGSQILLIPHENDS